MQSILLFQPFDRDIAHLKYFCQNNSYHFFLASNEDEFQSILLQNPIRFIIVSVRPNDLNSFDADLNADIKYFLDIARKHLLPEHADLSVYFSSEGIFKTPKYFPQSVDPRPIRNDIEYRSIDMFLEDKSWERTIYGITNAPKIPTSIFNPINRPLIISIKPSKTNFSSEAYALLKASFKDKSKIEIEFPLQGFSGSIVCSVAPIDSHGNKNKKRILKLYPKQQDVDNDYYRWSEYVVEYIQSEHYPPIPNLRYRGYTRSILISEEASGYKESLTLNQFIHSDLITTGEVEQFINDVFIIMDTGGLNSSKLGWKLITNGNNGDLFETYLGASLKNIERKNQLISEDIINKWFGSTADETYEKISIEDRIKQILSFNDYNKFKICHGDFHADNIVAKSIKGNICIPVFIDFSKTEETHYLIDIVTLELDLIIRGIEEIIYFRDINNFEHFLRQLYKKDVFDINQTLNLFNLSKKNEILIFNKVLIVLNKLRSYSFLSLGADPKEYKNALLLHALKVLSRGNRPYHHIMRLTSFISFTIREIK